MFNAVNFRKSAFSEEAVYFVDAVDSLIFVEKHLALLHVCLVSITKTRIPLTEQLPRSDDISAESSQTHPALA